MPCKTFWRYAALRPDTDGREEKEQALSEALEKAPHVIRGSKYVIGSQFHFYMEPQVWSLCIAVTDAAPYASVSVLTTEAPKPKCSSNTPRPSSRLMSQAAVAQPDEGGTIVVHSATQSLDTVQRAVAHALGVSVNKVRCKGTETLMWCPHVLMAQLGTALTLGSGSRAATDSWRGETHDHSGMFRNLCHEKRV